MLIVKYLTGGFSILYFLFVVIQLKLLTPYLFKHLTKESYKPFKDPLWLIIPVYLLMFTIIRLEVPEWFNSVDSKIAFDNFFPSWLLYYYLGMYCKLYTIKTRPVYLIISVLAFLYISINVAFILSDSSCILNFPFTQSKLSSMMYALSLILLLYSIRDDSTPRNIIARIGEMSFGIYILHLPIDLIWHKLVLMYNNSLLLAFYLNPFARFILVFTTTVGGLLLSYYIMPHKLIRIIGLQ